MQREEFCKIKDETKLAERLPQQMDFENLPYISPKTQARRDIKRNQGINRRGFAQLLDMATSSAQFIIDERPSDSANHF